MAAPSFTSATTVMALDVALELSVKQLISALNKRLLIEFTDVESKVPPLSRTSAAALTTEVRSGELKTCP